MLIDDTKSGARQLILKSVNVGETTLIACPYRKFPVGFGGQKSSCSPVMWVADLASPSKIAAVRDALTRSGITFLPDAGPGVGVRGMCINGRS